MIPAQTWSVQWSFALNSEKLKDNQKENGRGRNRIPAPLLSPTSRDLDRRWMVTTLPFFLPERV